VREETGLELADVRFVMVQDCIDSPEFMRPEHFLLLNYLGKADATDVTLNDEAQEFRWLAPDEAFALDLNQPTRLLLEETIAQGLL